MLFELATTDSLDDGKGGTEHTIVGVGEGEGDGIATESVRL